MSKPMHYLTHGTDENPGPTIYADVSPSYHPLVVDQIHGGDEQVEALLQPAWEAFAVVYESLNMINEARVAVASDLTLTPAAAKLKLAAYASDKQTLATRKMDAVNANLSAFISDAERKLNSPVAESARVSPFATEIRSHVKAMKSEDRHAWVNEMTRSGDLASLNAVLGAPAFLSGLDDKMQKVLAKHHHSVVNPGLVKQLDAMKKAQDKLLDMGTKFVHGDVEKSMGLDWREVSRLQDLQKKANKPFSR